MSRDISSYPVLLPERTASGFYGPWTHPPFYVALIYLSSVLQGHAETPGLMRMISPWFALAATGLVLSLGASISRLAGFIAASVFLSAPLFYLGADSSLIDALSVLGFTMMIATIIGLKGSSVVRGGLIGGAVGFGLWTHSQAILLLPLGMFSILCFHGWRKWSTVLCECIFLAFSSCLLAMWPYLKNVTIFGSPISDSPAVFALPKLDWAGYFSVMRGLDNWTARVQYGVFKGWFALEAYSFIFWLMGIGFVLFAVRLRNRRWGGLRAGLIKTNDQPVLLVACGVITFYLVGVVVSIILGLDLMIKNERYLLIILSAVAIVASYGCVGWGQRELDLLDNKLCPIKSKTNIIHRVFLLLLASVLLLQLLVLNFYRMYAYGLPISSLGQDFQKTLENRADFLAANYLRKNLPPGSLVLSLRPADMYYAKQKMLSYLDPQLLPFYRQDDPLKGLEDLYSLGVTHIHSSDYSLPPFYNSVLQKIMRNPLMSNLVFSADGHQIYALKPSPLTTEASIDILPGVLQWTKSTQLIISRQKVLSGLSFEDHIVVENRISQGGLPFSLFHRNWSTILHSEMIPVFSDREYAIDLVLGGEGLVRFWLRQYNDKREPIRDKFSKSDPGYLIGDVFLRKERRAREFSKRIQMLGSANYVQLEIEHVGTSSLQIQKASLSLFVSESN